MRRRSLSYQPNTNPYTRALLLPLSNHQLHISPLSRAKQRIALAFLCILTIAMLTLIHIIGLTDDIIQWDLNWPKRGFGFQISFWGEDAREPISATADKQSSGTVTEVEQYNSLTYKTSTLSIPIHATVASSPIIAFPTSGSKACKAHERALTHHFIRHHKHAEIHRCVGVHCGTSQPAVEPAEVCPFRQEPAPSSSPDSRAFLLATKYESQAATEFLPNADFQVLKTPTRPGGATLPSVLWNNPDTNQGRWLSRESPSQVWSREHTQASACSVGSRAKVPRMAGMTVLIALVLTTLT